MQRWMHPPQTNLVVGLCVAVLLLAYSTPASALSDVPSTMAVKSTAKYADDASHVHSITPLPKSNNANLNYEARQQREQQQLRTRTAASASPATPLASGKSLLADTPAAASSSSVVPAPAGSSPAATAVNSSTAASNLSQPIVWPPPSTMLIAPLSADITNRIPNFSQPSTVPTPAPTEKKPVEEIEEDDPNTSEWLQRFLKPTEQDTLHASLKVHVPTNVSTVFERKQFAVRMLLDRIHATREEIDRLAAIHVESIVTIKRQMKRVSTIFRNFQKLYFVHQQAMDAPIAAKGSAKYEESKRRNAVTLLPLLYTSKRLVKEKNTLMVLLDTWKSAAPLNVETRFHLRRDVVRLQRQLGILFVEVTTLPLF